MGIQEMPSKVLEAELVTAVEDLGQVVDWLQAKQNRLSEFVLQAQFHADSDVSEAMASDLADVDRLMTRAMRAKGLVHKILDAVEG